MAVTEHASGTQAATVGTEHLHIYAAGFFDGEGCAHALRAMLPYLMVKRSEAEVALAFQARRMSHHDPRRYNRQFVTVHRMADEETRTTLAALKRGGGQANGSHRTR